MKSLKTLLIVVLAAGSMVACNKNDSGGSGPARPGTSVIGNAGSATGYVTSSYNMTGSVQGLLASPSYDINQFISSVNGSNGLGFNGIVRFDNANNVVPNQSYINLLINYLDPSNQTKTYSFGMWATQGQVLKYATYASVSLTFEDTYTKITMTGNYDSTNFVGEMYYYNKQTNSQGDLGQFRIQTCGFFNCIQ